jgi:nucleoside-diphosphate-sugar epimerase
VANPLADDLQSVLEEAQPSWEALRGARLFLTGGTGFIGCWLLESFCWANNHLKLGATATVLTRDPASFAAKCPHLAGDPAIHLHPGDVRCFDFPAEDFTHIILGAAEASAVFNMEQPFTMFETIVLGTQHTLELAQRCGAPRLLLISSGAVYGMQPPDLTHVPEDYRGGPDPTSPTSAYAEGKRAAELLSVLHARAGNPAPVIARPFAFVGPYLPQDRHFAIGNFIRDAMAGGPILVTGDGTPVRSYLYAVDMAVWLWVLLTQGVPGRAYNVGSEEEITIADLADAVASQVTPRPQVVVASPAVPGMPATCYVPSTRWAQENLGLRATVGLKDAITRTMAWYAMMPGFVGPRI